MFFTMIVRSFSKLKVTKNFLGFVKQYDTGKNDLAVFSIENDSFFQLLRWHASEADFFTLGRKMSSCVGWRRKLPGGR